MVLALDPQGARSSAEGIEWPLMKSELVQTFQERAHDSKAQRNAQTVLLLAMLWRMIGLARNKNEQKRKLTRSQVGTKAALDNGLLSQSRAKSCGHKECQNLPKVSISPRVRIPAKTSQKVAIQFPPQTTQHSSGFQWLS